MIKHKKKYYTYTTAKGVLVCNTEIACYTITIDQQSLITNSCMIDQIISRTLFLYLLFMSCHISNKNPVIEL